MLSTVEFSAREGLDNVFRCFTFLISQKWLSESSFFVFFLFFDLCFCFEMLSYIFFVIYCCITHLSIYISWWCLCQGVRILVRTIFLFVLLFRLFLEPWHLFSKRGKKGIYSDKCSKKAGGHPSDNSRNTAFCWLCDSYKYFILFLKFYFERYFSI